MEPDVPAAKPNPSIPGCSGHTHYSLWDLDGTKNLFHDPADPKGMSDLMKHFLAGQLHCLPDILPMFMPFINRCARRRLPRKPRAPVALTSVALGPLGSAVPRPRHSYKRMVENAWAPIVATWGLENRTAAIRVINMSPKSTRVEVRVGGADINPYLCVGAPRGPRAAGPVPPPLGGPVAR